MPKLGRLLNSHKNNIRREACWTLSNILNGTTDQIQEVIDAELIPPLVQLVATADNSQGRVRMVLLLGSDGTDVPAGVLRVTVQKWA